MPVISRFLGIAITILYRDHDPPPIVRPDQRGARLDLLDVALVMAVRNLVAGGKGPGG